MKRLFDLFLSLKLTVTLLALSMVLIFVGTLAQVDKGIWTVMDQYFRCWIAWIELSVFFPSSAPGPAVVVPFPGGFLLGSLLSLNLLAVHSSTFKVLVKGRRLWVGYSLLLLGLVITVQVVLGWGTAPVAATENDAFWRYFSDCGELLRGPSYSRHVGSYINNVQAWFCCMQVFYCCWWGSFSRRCLRLKQP